MATLYGLGNGGIIMFFVMPLPSQFKNQLVEMISAAIADIGAQLPENINIIERPRIAAHGDFSCPLALTLAKQLRRKPQEIAEQLLAAITLPPFVAEAQIVAPGFINFKLHADAKVTVVREVLAAQEQYGIIAPQNESVLLEFVSANPTGPLHVGHGRACAYGDALANILTAAGNEVRCEYYVNNAGRQMDILAASLWLRYWLLQNNDTTPMPEGAYRGDYLVAVTTASTALKTLLQQTQPPADTLADSMTACATTDLAADTLVVAARTAAGSADAYTQLRQQTGTIMLEEVIKKDMQALTVATDRINFFYETELHDNGQVAAAIDTLQQRQQLYEQDGALWFKSSDYGDEKDRVVCRANGELTYFAADIAYHADKLSRPHPPQNHYRIINVLGADHHGYVPRLSAAMQALGFNAQDMETEIIQFVALFEGGERLKMSTRAGEFVTLQELVASVGAEAARFYYLSRKNDQHLDFDLTAAKAQERNNPIYYLHYANARIFRIIENWQENFQGDTATLATADIQPLAQDSAAIALCEQLILYPETIARAAAERAPHLLTAYLSELATQLHNYYEQSRILPAADDTNAATDSGLAARVALLWATCTVLNNAARLLGLKLPESM